MLAGKDTPNGRETSGHLLPTRPRSKSLILFISVIILLESISGCSQVAANNNNYRNENGIDEQLDGAKSASDASSEMLFEPGLMVVSTFESLGIYWRPNDGVKGEECYLRYRIVGEPNWKNGLPLWFDSRNTECRGSLVHLKPDTSYQIELSLKDAEDKETISARTWSESFPILREVILPETSDTPLVITQSGSAEGYVLYTHAPSGTAAINVEGMHDSNIVIDASYVIIRGLELKNAATHAIDILGNSHDIVIEDNDISGWGAVAQDGWGEDYHSAIFASSDDESQLARLVIQRNRIHHPRSDSNAWDEYRVDREEYHPQGPQAITLWNTAGNHVIRYNEIYSDEDHKFNDCMGGGENYSDIGFPNKDSDIYGNFISGCWDDGIEAEGANANVRIWGNYIDMSYVMIAVAATQIGPIYIWRNVADRSRLSATKPMESAKRGVFLKTQNKTVRGRYYGGGRIYVFHNTLLQGNGANQGVYSGLTELGSEMINIVSRNNILHVNADYRYSIDDTMQSDSNDFDYDLYNGQITGLPAQEANGITGTPIFDLENSRGPFFPFYLLPLSPGHDDGAVIPNFSDGYEGAAPDIGAYEANSTKLRFGIE